MIRKMKIKIAKVIIGNVNSVLECNDSQNNTVKTWQYFKMIRGRWKKILLMKKIRTS